MYPEECPNFNVPCDLHSSIAIGYILQDCYDIHLLVVYTPYLYTTSSALCYQPSLVNQTQESKGSETTTNLHSHWLSAGNQLTTLRYLCPAIYLILPLQKAH